MQSLIRYVIYIFLFIFAATAIMSLVALGYLWYQRGTDSGLTNLPYLGWLLTIVIAEVVGVVVMVAKKGLKYLPQIHMNKTEAETLQFMKNFINSGSSVTVVSNRVAWLNKSTPLREAIIEMARGGTQLEIITPDQIAEDIRNPLHSAGVHFYATGESHPPEARFTLVNGHRSGAEQLAIARGSHPEHEITVFDNSSGPQIIAMAKDIIRKSKSLSDAA